MSPPNDDHNCLITNASLTNNNTNSSVIPSDKIEEFISATCSSKNSSSNELLYSTVEKHNASSLFQDATGEKLGEMINVERMSTKWLVVFSLFPLALTSCFTFSLAVLLPLQLVTIVGNENKAYALGIIGAIRAIAASIIGLIVGYVSDHLATRFGKRKPFIFAGCALNAVLFFMRAFMEKPGTSMLIVNTSLLVLGDMAGQMAITCYMSMFPELFQTNQIGLLSGLNSFVQLLASAVGVGLMGFLYDTYLPPVIILGIISIWMLVHAIAFVLLFKEPVWHYTSLIAWVNPYKQRMLYLKNSKSDETMINNNSNYLKEDEEEGMEESSIGYMTGSIYASLEHVTWKERLLNLVISLKIALVEVLSCFRSWSFLWLFLTRCTFTLSLGILQTVGLYFFQDKVGPTYWFFGNSTIIKDAQQAQAIFMVCVLATGLGSSVLGGILSDRIGRKPVVMLSSMLIAAAMAFLGIFISSYTILLGCAILAGFGVGAFMASDLGLANDVIDCNSSGKELSTFQISQTLPLIISGPACALILGVSNKIFNNGELFGIKNVGYNILLVFCVSLNVFTAVGVWFIRPETIRSHPSYQRQLEEPQEKGYYQYQNDEKGTDDNYEATL